MFSIFGLTKRLEYLTFFIDCTYFPKSFFFKYILNKSCSYILYSLCLNSDWIKNDDCFVFSKYALILYFKLSKKFSSKKNIDSYNRALTESREFVTDKHFLHKLRNLSLFGISVFE